MTRQEIHDEAENLVKYQEGRVKRLSRLAKGDMTLSEKIAAENRVIGARRVLHALRKAHFNILDDAYGEDVKERRREYDGKVGYTEYNYEDEKPPLREEEIKTSTHIAGAGRCDQVGRYMGCPVNVVAGGVGKGMAKRIADYANERLSTAGLSLKGATLTVAAHTSEGGGEIEGYSVEWENEDTILYLDRILIGKGGWPVMDHGLRLNP